MCSPVMDALCLAHHPRWIELSDAHGWVHAICSNCGEPRNYRRGQKPKACPRCHEWMEGERMNHDYAHCADWKEDCPKECFRGQLVEDLRKHHYGFPVSFMHFEGTVECRKAWIRIDGKDDED